MSDVIKNSFPQLYKLLHMINFKCNKYYYSVLSMGKKFFEKGKIQIEVEKLKLELNKKYRELGKYVTQKKEIKSAIDFSHDQVYLQKINEIIKLKLYIEDRFKSKRSF